MKEFFILLAALQKSYDLDLGRKYNQDAYFHKIREWSRYLTYVFFKLGLKG